MIDQVYMQYDQNGTGALEMNEFVPAFNQVVSQLGINRGYMDSNQIMQLMAQIDRSGDGRIQRPEFFALVQKLMGGF